MAEKNNLFHYKVNDSMDVVVEISNKIDRGLKNEFENLFPETERKTVLEIL